MSVLLGAGDAQRIVSSVRGQTEDVHLWSCPRPALLGEATTRTVSLAVTAQLCPPPAARLSFPAFFCSLGLQGYVVLFLLQLSCSGNWTWSTTSMSREEKGSRRNECKRGRELKLKDYTSGGYFSLVTRIFLSTKNSGCGQVQGWFTKGLKNPGCSPLSNHSILNMQTDVLSCSQRCCSSSEITSSCNKVQKQQETDYLSFFLSKYGTGINLRALPTALCFISSPDNLPYFSKEKINESIHFPIHPSIHPSTHPTIISRTHLY